MLKLGAVTQTSGGIAIDADAPPIEPARSTDMAAQPDRAARHVWILVALAPLIFALTCWNPAAVRRPLQDVSLAYSLPITVIELAVIVFATRSGYRLAGGLSLLSAWQKAALGLLVAVAVGTAAVAALPAHSAIRTYQLLVHLMFGFAAFHLFRTRWAPLTGEVWPWAVAGTCLYTLAIIPWVLAVQDDPNFDWVRFSYAVVHIRQTGFYAAAGSAAAIGLAAVARTWRGYWLAVAAATLLVALSCWSGTRGSLIALVAALVAGAILLPALRNRRMVAALLISAVAGALLSLAHPAPRPYYGLWRILGTVEARDPDEFSSSRIVVWQAGGRAFLKRPILGYGESQFGVAVPQWRQYNHPHNIFVQLLIQWGIVGFLCYVALGAALVWRFAVGARRGGPDMAAPFLAGTALMTMSLYEGTLYHPYPYMMIVLSLAFVLAARPLSPSAEPRPAA